MQANPKSLADVLRSADRFVIPEYQRPYCWTIEDVEQLWDDIYEAYRDEAASTPAGDPYFLGPIVVAKQHNQEADLAVVVDGQQRLTTLHTLLWCGWHRLGADGAAADLRSRIQRFVSTSLGPASLVVARADQPNFLAVQTGGPVNEERALGLTATFLRDRIARLEKPDDVVGFLQFVLSRTQFILVETESYASAWDLFIGLNGKGRPLNAADLIKAYVCGKSTDSQATADVWQERVLPLGNDATSALLEITRVATGDAGSEAKLFRTFEQAWSASKISLQLLSDGASAYHTLWHAPLPHVPSLAAGAKRPLRGLRRLERRDHTSVLLAFAAAYGLAAALEPSLLAALEAYQFSMAIRGKRGRERKFTDLAASVFAQPPGLPEARERLRKLLRELAPSRDEVVGAVCAAAYPGRIMKFIVSQYEEGVRGDIQIDDVQYEHIMPKTGTAFWYAAAGTREPNEYARLVNNIGNIAPLDQLTNVLGSNDDWSIKRALYKSAVPNWLVARLAEERPLAWLPEDIRSRASMIATWAVNVRWPLDQALSSMGA